MQIEGGLPANLRIKMLINIIFDFVIGLVPLLGDLADAAFRANTKNAVMLEEHLREKGQKNLRQSGMPIPAVDPSDPDEYERGLNSRTPDNRSPAPSRQPSPRPARNDRHDRHDHEQPLPTEPRPAETRQSGGGWFGRSNRHRPDDVEMGRVDHGRTDSRRTRDKRSNGRR